MSYHAKILRITVRPHPNADRLQLGDVDEHQVVVGQETQDNTLGVFFPADGQVSHEFCVANNLYAKDARAALGLPPSDDCGFFSVKRRVRAQGFRGERSEGFWCPLSFLNWIDPQTVEKLEEGVEFDTLDGQVICQKYETPATKAARIAGQGRTSRKDSPHFPRHEDTKQFRFVSHALPADGVYYLTEKLHGTSGRFGYVLEPLPLSWCQRAANRILEALGGSPMWSVEAYQHLNGSKNVILERQKIDTGGYYGSNQFRHDAIESLRGTLYPDEVLFYEIVGYDGDRPIMPPQPIKPELREIRQTYGEYMHYHYGCAVGELAVFVYKIVQGASDGSLRELSFPEVVRRCQELNLSHVPVLGGPFTVAHCTDAQSRTAVLQQLLDIHVDGASRVDPRHIREGVVLRVESVAGVQHVKYKSWTFGVLEGYIKDTDTYVDTEEIA